MKIRVIFTAITSVFVLAIVNVGCSYENDDDQTIRPDIEEPENPTPEPLPAEYLAALDHPNSFIVKPGKNITISIIKAFAVWRQYEEIINAQLSRDTKLSVSLVWQDQPGLITELNLSKDEKEYSEITVQTANKKGNAVIAIKADGKICWSWHIWSTNYDPDNQINGRTYKWDNNNDGIVDYVWMDRNLGADSNGTQLTTADSIAAFGLLYQWGRKDPFPGDRTFSNPGGSRSGYSTTYLDSHPIYDMNNNLLPEKAFESGNGVHLEWNTDNQSMSNLLKAIANPIKYILGDNKNSYGFWFLTNWEEYGKAVAFWDRDGSKGVFDPCPHGWRIPAEKNDRHPWNGFDVAATPYSKLGVFPYAGNRGNEFHLGILMNAGYSSRIWSAKPISVEYHGHCIVISRPESPEEMKKYKFVNYDYSSRNEALSVRCVKDSQ